ncbi:hypothetical protein NQZ79_g1055 [Umbelopsis isabellina]|nr:hypothetical protein NQZ79_g1055 [Umbelopsis isabellina]
MSQSINALHALYPKTPCQKPVVLENAESSAPVQEKATKRDTKTTGDDDEQQLTVEQLQSLGQSEALREYLMYPQIRKLLSAIDSADNPAKALDEARRDDPVFNEALDEMLQAVTGQKPGSKQD